MTTDILAVLAWVAGPGLAIISAFVLEQLRPFSELSSNGKLVVAITVAGILGVASTALATTLAQDSAMVAQLQPYANVIVPALSLLAQQLTHGNQLAKSTFEIGEEGAAGLISGVWSEDKDL